MSPFGDIIDENLWVIREDMRLHLYLRQFENRENWFFGGGARIVDYPVSEKIRCSAALHLWNQPLDLAFNTPTADFGGAVDILVKYPLFHFGETEEVKYFSADFGLNAKTSGFLPEVMFLDERVSFRLGCTFVF